MTVHLERGELVTDCTFSFEFGLVLLECCLFAGGEIWAFVIYQRKEESQFLGWTDETQEEGERTFTQSMS